MDRSLNETRYFLNQILLRTLDLSYFLRHQILLGGKLLNHSPDNNNIPGHCLKLLLDLERQVKNGSGWPGLGSLVGDVSEVFCAADWVA